MELVDPNVSMETTNNQDFAEMPPPKHYTDYMKPPLKGEGWGSPQATEMVLNNLLFITAKVRHASKTKNWNTITNKIAVFRKFIGVCVCVCVCVCYECWRVVVKRSNKQTRPRVSRKKMHFALF